MRIFLRLLLLFFCSTLAMAQPTMVKMVVTNITPGNDPESFLSAPRTIYRQGTAYARVEEEPSPDGLHLAIIRSQTDLWQMDLNGKTASHQGGLSPDASVPISLDFYDLEFGQEIEFMRQNEVTPEPTELPDGSAGLSYRVRTDEVAIELIASKEGQIPKAVQFMDMNGTVLMRIEYLSYARDLPFQPELFVMPEGFQVSEQESQQDQTDE